MLVGKKILFIIITINLYQCTLNTIKVSAYDRSDQSRVKIMEQCKAFALYQEEHSHGCSSKELPEATESHCQSWW